MEGSDCEDEVDEVMMMMVREEVVVSWRGDQMAL